MERRISPLLILYVICTCLLIVFGDGNMDERFRKTEGHVIMRLWD